MKDLNTSITKKSALIAGALAASLLVGGAAVAGGKNYGDREGHRGQSGMMSEKRMDRLASKLELSDEQKTQVLSIMETNREKQQALREQNREALKAELGTVLSAEQMEELEAMMEKRGGKRGGKHDKQQKRMQKNSKAAESSDS